MNSNLPPQSAFGGSDFGASHEPDPDALLAMAYVDGELAPEERSAFEARMRTESQLVAHVAEMRDLSIVARNLIPPEPEDREWRKLARDPWQTGGLRIGWFCCILAAVGFTIAAALSMLDSGEHWGMKLFFFAGGAGAGILLLLTLRERLAVLPFDPYRKLQR